MRKVTATVLFLAVAVPMARGQDDAAKAAKALEGTYEVLEATRGGKPDPKSKDVTAFVIKDGEITIKTAERDEPATFTLDPSKKPAEIDIMPGKGAEAVKGIYMTKETDKGLELTIAFARGKGERPKDFKGEGADETMVKLLRKK